MAIIECPECKREISSEAQTCPSCGFPIQESTSPQPQIAPQSPVIPPGIEPNWMRVTLGIICAFIGGWATFHWVPSHSPYLVEEIYEQYPGKLVGDAKNLNPTEVIRAFKGKPPSGCPDWYFPYNLYYWALGFAALFFVGGIFEVFYGMLYKNYKILFCKKCDMQVVARKKKFDIQCEKCGAVIERKYSAYASLIILILTAIVIIWWGIQSTTRSNSSNSKKPTRSFHCHIPCELARRIYREKIYDHHSMAI